MGIFEDIGAVVAGAGATAGEFFAGLTKPFAQQVVVPSITQTVQEVSPVIRDQINQSIKETLPLLRGETVTFIQQTGSASAQAAKQNVQAFLPIIALVGLGAIAVSRR